MKLGRVVGWGITISVIVLAVAGVVFQQDIFDWYKLRDYSPSAEVIELADSTTMTPSSRKLFYINRPVIADNSIFNEHCRENEYSIVLGCYLSGQNGIYLLDVKDERLQGIKEVTAAHEVLHAVYERLSDSEREKVDRMVTDAFKDVKSTRVQEAVELYRKQDPSIVPNELHSILGSEVRSLPKDLEDYYSKHFVNRLKVVEFSEEYEQAFVNRRNAIREYDIELQELKSRIESESSRLTEESAQLNQLKLELDSLSNNIELFNQRASVFNSRANAYNRDIDALESEISNYNSIVQKRNDVVVEEGELIKAIDSREVVPTQR